MRYIWIYPIFITITKCCCAILFIYFVIQNVEVFVSLFDQMSVSGICANKTLLEEDFAIFAYDWCPYQYAWISVLGIALYLAFFSPGNVCILTLDYKIAQA